MDEPIVVLGFPRTGHSMVTGIIHIHGAWVGTVPQKNNTNPTGFFTNLAIKTLLVREYGQGTDFILEKRKIRDRIEKAIIEDGYEGGPWVFKNPVTYHDAWHEFNPVFVKVIRDRQSIIESNNRKRMAALTKMSMEEAIDNYLRLCDEYEGISVYPSKIINGDYSEIEQVIEAGGMKFDPSLVDNFVDRSLWHEAGL